MTGGHGHCSAPDEGPLPSVSDLQGMHPAEKASVAGRRGLTPELVDALVHCDDELVAAALAMNSETPPVVLLTLAQRHPTAAVWVAVQPNAPALLKDSVPLRDHTAYSSQLYLDERGASEQERAAMYAEHGRLPPPGGPPLREVWDRVRGSRPG